MHVCFPGWSRREVLVASVTRLRRPALPRRLTGKRAAGVKGHVFREFDGNMSHTCICWKNISGKLLLSKSGPHPITGGQFGKTERSPFSGHNRPHASFLAGLEIREASAGRGEVVLMKPVTGFKRMTFELRGETTPLRALTGVLAAAFS